MACSIHSGLARAPRTRVSVNGVVIPHDAIARETQNHPAKSPLDAWRAAARALVIRKLLLQEAQRLQVATAPDESEAGYRETEDEAMIRALFEREVATPEPDEESCRRYYEQNRVKFRSPDIYEAAHILIAARRSDPEAYRRARETAQRLHLLIERDPHRFAALASEHSDCPSSAAGGNLGQITTRQTTPEFEKALLELAPGTMASTPVETRYGFHILRLDRHIPGRELPFEAVRDQIAAHLGARVRWIAAAQYVARLAARASIEGVELATPANLRVT